MRGIGKPLKHQSEGDVAEKRGYFGRGIGIAFGGHDITTRTFRYHGNIAIYQRNRYLRFSKSRKNACRCHLAGFRRERTNEKTRNTLTQTKFSQPLGSPRYGRTCSDIGDK